MSDRAEFEDWVKSQGAERMLDKYPSGNYSSQQMNLRWEGWQAARAQGGQGAESVAGELKQFWQNLQAFVDDYVSAYEFRGDDGDYQPNERERFLLEDCAAGLLHELSAEGYLNKPAQQGAPESIATDDDVEQVAKMAGWDNRKYMTPRDYAEWCRRMREFVRLSSTPQPGGDGWIPKGWKLAPVTPTDEMCMSAASADLESYGECGEPAQFSDIWTSMLSAAPNPPEQGAK